MASRTGASVGIITFIACISLTWLALFVGVFILIARVQKLNNDLSLARTDLDAAIRTDERDDRWEQLKGQAKGRGVVRYLDTTLQDVTASITGSRRDDPAALAEKIKAAAGPDGTALLTLLNSRNEDLARLQSRLEAADNARLAAQSDLQAMVDRVRTLEEEHRATVAKLNSEIDTYKDNTTQYRDSVEAAKADFTTRADTIRSDSETAISSLETRARELEQELLIANDQLRKLKLDQAGQSLRPNAEEALVDARIVGVNAAARQVYLDVGRRERAVLGMTFEVYGTAGAIIPNASGEYPSGKGSIEIIRIDETTSVARIIRENAGTPIISGDIVANAVYDPNKTYTFTVYGNFDTNADGIATPQEMQDIKGLIESWNGLVLDDISGDTDFLVLGEKPILPPQPKPSDPVELIQRYLMLRQQVTKYDELFNKATQAGIPVLNQNRLYTLTGVQGRR